MKKKHIIILSCVTFVILIFSAVSLKIGNNPVANAVGSVFSPVQKWVSKAYNATGDFIGSMMDSGDNARENKKLREENLELKAQMRMLESYKSENDELRKLIELRESRTDFKSTAANVMRKLGIYVVDADEVAHNILKKGEAAYFEVLKVFGEEYLFENGEINRRKLGALVFADKEKLGILNGITHKYIREKLLNLKNENGVTVYDAPLPPKGFMEVDHILYITAPQKMRVKRIIMRDGISEEEAISRLENQRHIDEGINLADTIIENGGDEAEFITKIKNWCEYEKII